MSTRLKIIIFDFADNPAVAVVDNLGPLTKWLTE
jgi:hypothetical protein